MLIRARDIPLAFTALTISLLIFASAWFAPWPPLCPKEPELGGYSNQTQAAIARTATGQRAANSRNNQCDEHEASDWWATRIGIGTGIILFGQLLMFFWQLRAMRDGVRDAAIAAQASRDSADTAKLSMIASGRAYVHHAGIRWISHRSHDGTVFWRIRPHWINNGNTPTRQARVFVRYELIDSELGADYPFIAEWKEPWPVAMLPPHSEIESEFRDVWGKDLAAVSRGEKHFYIWGVAIYRDVFPETEEHVTKFCVRARNIMGDPMTYWDKDTNPMEIRFMTYGRHNCADEDCQRRD